MSRDATPPAATPYVIAPWELPSLPVAGGGRFPVRRIFCVGRNYAEHAREMGHDPSREAPFFFMKPADCLLESGGILPYPPQTQDLHHEIELVVALAEGGRDIPESEAQAKIYGYAVGLDMTRRDLQGAAKKAGRPWEAGKAADHAAPCGTIHPAATVGHPDSGRIWLTVNGTPRQEGDLNQLIWSVPEVIAHLSALFELKSGDLIYTGTPAGVGAVVAGDVLRGGIDGLGELDITIG